jgi:hypothetical protein
MNENKLTNEYRRSFLKKLGIGMAILPTTSLISLSSIAYADDMPLVAEDDPIAVSLSYVGDATTSTARTDETAVCSTCQLYTGEEGSETGPCSIFPGKLVQGNGWCSAWTKKA